MVKEFLCSVQEVRSGDDLVLLVDLGFEDLHKRVRARLKGVDTPDAYKEGNGTTAGAIRDEVRKLTRERCKVVLLDKTRNGWLVDLYILQSNADPVNLNELLISRGYAFAGKDAL